MGLRMAQTLAELIKGYRLRKGLTQKELAESTSVTKGYIAALEQGVRRKPAQALLEKIEEILDLSEREFHNLCLVARGAEIPISAGKVVSYPLFQALEKLLAAPADSTLKTECLEAFYKRLAAALAGQGIPRQIKKENQRWSLVSRGYAYTSPKKDKQHPSSSPEKLSRHLKDKTDMGVSIRALLDIFLDTKIPYQKRTALAKELLSLAEWRCHAKAEVGNQNRDSEKP